MKRLILALALALAGAAHAQTAAPDDTLPTKDLAIEELVGSAAQQHPVALYLLAMRFLDADKGQEAAKWMYVAQLRYRILLATTGDSDAVVLFNALHEQVGRPVNEYIAGNVDEWIAAIDAALEWDAANQNVLTPEAEHADAITAEREGLLALRAQIEENRDEIPRMRAESGLENR